MDTKQIELEGLVLNLLNSNNNQKNTFHFVWYSNGLDGVNLELVSRNPITGVTFLLMEVESQTFNSCLELVLEKLKGEYWEYSWNVLWVDGENETRSSYFSGRTEEEVQKKFYYNDEHQNLAIISIKKMPIS